MNFDKIIQDQISKANELVGNEQVEVVAIQDMEFPKVVMFQEKGKKATYEVTVDKRKCYRFSGKLDKLLNNQTSNIVKEILGL